MISLITISCITAAFTPIITKKLKNSDVTVALSEVATKCNKFTDECSLCYSSKCIACSRYCNENQYKNNDSCLCENCTDRSIGCLRCNKTACTLCETGHGLTVDGKCQLCSAGYYSDGTYECKACPVGKYQDEEGKNICKNCPINKYQDEEGQNYCKTPSNGSYQDQAGQSTTKICPEDNYCTDGIKTPCGAGQGANEGASLCTACSTKIANCAECSNLSQCTKCNAGYYLSSGNCVQCPAGSRCDGINKTTCSAGTYSLAGASNCTNCPAGQYQDVAGQSSCKTCSSKTTNCTKCNAVNGTCTACKSGYKLNSTSTSCVVPVVCGTKVVCKTRTSCPDKCGRNNRGAPCACDATFSVPNSAGTGCTVTGDESKWNWAATSSDYSCRSYRGGADCTLKISLETLKNNCINVCRQYYPNAIEIKYKGHSYSILYP